MFLNVGNSSFRRRVLSSFVLAPVFFLAVWAGFEGFAAFIALCSILMIWEWSCICLGRFDWAGYCSFFVCCVAIYLVLSGHFCMAIAFLGLAAVIILCARRSVWLSVGLVYIGGSSASLVWMYGVSGSGTVLWLLFVVWATDVGAYVVGRMLGGARLAPRISPNKTWAGLFGGAFFAMIVGGLFPFFLGFASWGPALFFALFLAFIAQSGDLFESYLKRRFGVKDSGSLIPGHGGILDRMDGLIAVAPVVATSVAVWGGGLETW